ncbi:NADH-quinone oxidoreductase subunit NuoN [Mycobacterium hubeiense]|uniref:NADH-quinone oxidoreductase subunit NuoN n=1 Tax=Mycobacterium hubeiense TaxID=1867256 RepID=UPI000C7EA4B6|nr:NADH-quinone oxidoreductase subunit NuoN [Mycobacterium sp. QGD 101]
MSIPTPSVEYAQLSPMLIVFGAAVAGVLVEGFVPCRGRYPAQLALSASGLVTAFVAVVLLAGHHGSVVMGSVMIDGPALFLQGAILLTGIVAIVPIAERSLAAFAPQGSLVPGSPAEQSATSGGVIQTEIFPLTMMAIGGMLLFPAAADLLTMFVALEVLSLPLYLLCGLARHRRLLSQEAALKYFLLGAFSSALFLYGIAMLYGYAGTLTFAGIADAITTRRGDTSMLLTGIALLAVGLLFKAGAVPFQSWVPDVYQGAPTPITGLMAAATKITAFGAMLRIFYIALPELVADWRPVLWGIATLTMVVAAVLTVVQTDVKRLLAYSSVANVGFILLGVTATRNGLSSTLFYLVAYGFSTLGAFAVVSLIRRADGEEATDISRWNGLGRRSPTVAAAMALFLLAIAGIPLTSGFVSKFAIFTAAMNVGAAGLVVVGALSSAIAAFAYARVIVLMFFTEPSAETPRAAVPTKLTAAAVTVAAGVTVLLGIAPQPVLDLANAAGQFMR